MAEQIVMSINVDELARASSIIKNIRTYYNSKIVGQSQLGVSLLVSMIANGHILLESVPGLAKTTAAKVMTEAVGGSFSRVLDKKREAGFEDFSMLMVDVNFLKRVNDTYGHEEGNLYLQGAAELMAKVFGRDCLYRIGGDEFVQILEGKAQDGVEDRIRTFNEEVKKLQADDSLKPWEKISAAVGIAKYEKGRDATAEETLRRADEAMYREKIAMKANRTD